LGGSVHIIKKYTKAFFFGSKGIGLDVNVDKTKYMVMSRDQNAGRNHSVRIDNCTFERMEEFKYLVTTLTNQNSIQKEMKSKLKPWNACYPSVQNLLSSSLLSKNLKIKVYRIIILPLVLCGCQTWSLTLREKRKMKVPENRVLMRIFWSYEGIGNGIMEKST